METKAPTWVEGGMMMSAFLMSINQSSVDRGPNAMLNSPLPKPLHEYACTLNLKLPQFCCSRDTALGKMTGVLLS